METVTTRLEQLDELLTMIGIRMTADYDGDRLMFLHFSCISVSAQSRRFVIEHFAEDDTVIRTIRISATQVSQTARLVKNYAHSHHEHGVRRVPPTLRLVDGGK